MKSRVKTRVEELTVNFERNETFYRGRRILLTKNEQKILELLIRNANHTVSSERLIEVVYRDREDGGALSNTLKVNICSLRRKIYNASNKRFILTVPCFGYQLVPPDLWYSVWDRSKKHEEKERTND